MGQKQGFLPLYPLLFEAKVGLWRTKVDVYGWKIRCFFTWKAMFSSWKNDVFLQKKQCNASRHTPFCLPSSILQAFFFLFRVDRKTDESAWCLFLFRKVYILQKWVTLCYVGKWRKDSFALFGTGFADYYLKHRGKAAKNAYLCPGL